QRQHLAIIQVALDLVLLGAHIDALLVHVARGHDLAVHFRADAREGIAIMPPAPAAPDQGNVDAVLGAHHAATRVRTARGFARESSAIPKQRLASDWVTLGKSNVKVTRLAFGTGTYGGRVQRELGQEGFTRLVRHAYDNGVRFFETADTYGGMHEMLGIALKGIPRDTYTLMTKYRTPNSGDPTPRIDLFR